MLAQHDHAFRDNFAADARGDFELPERADYGDFAREERDLLGGPHRTEEFHPADGREPEGATGLAGGDAGSLGERFGEDDAGDERIAGKMTTKERLIGRKGLGALRAFAGNQRPHFPDENERRAMWQAQRDGIAGGHCAPSVGTK